MATSSETNLAKWERKTNVGFLSEGKVMNTAMLEGLWVFLSGKTRAEYFGVRHPQFAGQETAMGLPLIRFSFK